MDVKWTVTTCLLNISVGIWLCLFIIKLNKFLSDLKKLKLRQY